MLGIFALQFLFEARVVFAPEARQILGDLNGTHVGRENVDEDRDAPHRDFGCGVDVVEFLNAQGDMRGISEFVGNFGRLAVGKVEAFRSMFVEKVLLSGAEPGFEDVFDRFVFDIFVAESAVADLFDEMTAVFVFDGRQNEFRAPLAEEIQAQDPLIGGVVPVV